MPAPPSSHAGLFEATAQGELLHFNTRFAAMLGYPPQELVGGSLLDLIHPEERLNHQASLAHLASGKIGGLDIVRRLQRKDGYVLACRLTVDRVYAASGLQERVVGMIQALQSEEVQWSSAAGAFLNKGNGEQWALLEPDCGLVLSRDGCITECNLRFAQMLGGTPEDLLGQPLARFVADKDRTHLEKALSQGPFFSCALDMIGVAGKRVRVLAQGQPAHPGLREVIVVKVWDISGPTYRERELERLARTLKASHSSRLALFNARDETSYMSEVCTMIAQVCEHAAVWIGLLEPLSETLYVAATSGFSTDAAANTLGRLGAEGLNSPVQQAIQRGETVIARNISTENLLSTECQEQLDLGGHNTLVAVPVLADEGIIGIVGIFAPGEKALGEEHVQLLEALTADLAFGLKSLRVQAAREVAELTLDRHAKELEALIDTIPAVVYVKDMSMRYQKVNSFFCWKLGMSAEEVRGKTDRDFMPPDLAAACEASDRLAVETGHVVRTEDGLVASHGRCWSTTKTLIYDEDDQPTGLVGISVDVTEQKMVEAQRLSRLENQKDQLVRELHHRIKNHLQGVVGLLREHISAPEGVEKPIEEAIQLLLSIANVYGLQSRCADTRVDLHELLHAICNSVNGVDYLPPERPISTAFIVGAEAVPVALVLNELLTNAVKHTRSVPEASKQIRVSVEVGDHEAEVTIANRPASLPTGFDFGIGIGIGTGLELVGSLLPDPGATLDFRQEGDEVVVRLSLRTPVIESGE